MLLLIPSSSFFTAMSRCTNCKFVQVCIFLLAIFVLSQQKIIRGQEGKILAAIILDLNKTETKTPVYIYIIKMSILAIGGINVISKPISFPEISGVLFKTCFLDITNMTNK